jgi:hypothetical protein
MLVIAQEGAQERTVSFCFGHNSGWDRFTVYTMAEDSTVSVICPVVPSRCTFVYDQIYRLYSDVKRQCTQARKRLKHDDSPEAHQAKLQLDCEKRWLQDQFHTIKHPRDNQATTSETNLPIITSRGMYPDESLVECACVW